MEMAFGERERERERKEERDAVHQMSNLMAAVAAPVTVTGADLEGRRGGRSKRFNSAASDRIQERQRNEKVHKDPDCIGGRANTRRAAALVRASPVLHKGGGGEGRKKGRM